MTTWVFSEYRQQNLSAQHQPVGRRTGFMLANDEHRDGLHQILRLRFQAASGCGHLLDQGGV